MIAIASDFRPTCSDFQPAPRTCRLAADEFRIELHRGPNCLLAKLLPEADQNPDWSPLFERLRGLLERHFTYRLMLDLGEIQRFSTRLLKQLILLDRWVGDRGGTMRLCGLSSESVAVFHVCGLDRVFSVYPGRLDGAWTFGRLGMPGFLTTP
jgi:anti-anti-sigma regulatory factor